MLGRAKGTSLVDIEMESPSNGSFRSNLPPKKTESFDGAEEQNSEEMDIDFDDESMLFYPGKKLILIHTSKWRVRWDRSVDDS